MRIKLKDITLFLMSLTAAIASGSFLYLMTVPIVILVFFLLGVGCGALLVLWMFRDQLFFNPNTLHSYIGQTVDLAVSKLTKVTPIKPVFSPFTEENSDLDLFAFKPRPSITNTWAGSYVVHILDEKRDIRYISSISATQIGYTRNLDGALNFNDPEIAVRASLFCWMSNLCSVYVRVFPKSELTKDELIEIQAA